MSVDVYKSTDNITFTKIASVGAAVTHYDDTILSASGTYYYYLIGIQTTDAETDPSSTASITPV